MPNSFVKPGNLIFRHAWRPYQKRVLDAIEQHLKDKRLHVVAAPGAGKTTLGLEVFRRVGKPTLVLSPTRIIRDQWLERLHDFLDFDHVSDLEWISNDIHRPAFLTSATYQALHARFAETLPIEDEDPVDDEYEADEQNKALNKTDLHHFIETLKSHQIEVLMLDEAHHLRAEWWRVLDQVTHALPELLLVALTATPPYDAQGHEWNKYEQLCGPIDEEISVPELVKAGTLCPHQDYVWISNATASEKQQINEHDERVRRMCESLLASDTFCQLIYHHPWLVGNAIDEAELIKAPMLALSLLRFLLYQKQTLPIGLMQLMDLKVEDIGDLGRNDWQRLVEMLLFSKTYAAEEGSIIFIDQLKKQLRSSELLHNKELRLERSRRIERSLALSASKVKSCIEIHKHEYWQREEHLRQVILTDFIRDEALNSELDTGDLNLGAWPVFLGVTRQSPVPDRIALLTGRLCILPSQLLTTLWDHIPQESCRTESFGPLGQYQKISAPLNALTQAFTKLLIQGELRVLVGTRSLLGEGWDAPAVNSLILSSSVGSFMLTNQMRGRAIRLDRQQPDKASSIWHLVAINPDSWYGWSDYSDLKQRFRTFVGLSEANPSIENGFERLKLSALDQARLGVGNVASAMTAANDMMLSRLQQIGHLNTRWQEALCLDDAASVVPSVKIPGPPLLRSFHLRYSFAHLISQLLTTFIVCLPYALDMAKRSGQRFFLMLSLFLGGVVIYRLPQTWKALKILFRHLPVDGSLKNIAKALLASLCQANLIETSMLRIAVHTNRSDDGTFCVSISGCSFYESSLFADCLAEILGPIEQPRYLVLRRGEWLGMTRDDYHAVPNRLSSKQDLARIFYQNWNKYVGPTELIYTRNPEGRQRLLKAKTRAFSSVFEQEVKREDRWQGR